MGSNIVEWLNLSLRWIHLIAGISWIGSSFYFMWLDSHLVAPQSPKKGVEGELWMVHSGGFYQVEKRKIGPDEMPSQLHWFKWEAAFTWLSGLCLLMVTYYWNGALFLIDPAVAQMEPKTAVLISLSLVALSWFAYDSLWQSSWSRKWPGAVSIACFLAVGGMGYLLTHVFSGRGAYIHIGAVLGTLMVANVWIRILPAQKEMIDAAKKGRQPDFTLGTQAKRRSVHNSYMTFPVLFMMVSNHYPNTYGNRLNWLILALLMLLGAGIRHIMILRAKKEPNPWFLVPISAGILALIYLTTPPATKPVTEQVSSKPVPFETVKGVITQRCTSCHSDNPTDKLFTMPPSGITFDKPENIKALAERIKVRAIVSKTMPFRNQTKMTQKERDLLEQWIKEGAVVD